MLEVRSRVPQCHERNHTFQPDLDVRADIGEIDPIAREPRSIGRSGEAEVYSEWRRLLPVSHKGSNDLETTVIKQDPKGQERLAVEKGGIR